MLLQARLFGPAFALVFVVSQVAPLAAVRVDIVTDSLGPGGQALQPFGEALQPFGAAEADATVWPRSWTEAERSAAASMLGAWQDSHLNVVSFERVKRGLACYDFRARTWAELRPSSVVYFAGSVGGTPVRFSLEPRPQIAQESALILEVLEPAEKTLAWRRRPAFTLSSELKLDRYPVLTSRMTTEHAVLARSLLGTWRAPTGLLKSILGLGSTTELSKFSFNVTKDGNLAAVIDDNDTVLLQPSGVMFEGRELDNESIAHRFSWAENGHLLAEKNPGDSVWLVSAEMVPVAKELMDANATSVDSASASSDGATPDSGASAQRGRACASVLSGVAAAAVAVLSTAAATLDLSGVPL